MQKATFDPKVKDDITIMYDYTSYNDNPSVIRASAITYL